MPRRSARDPGSFGERPVGRSGQQSQQRPHRTPRGTLRSARAAVLGRAGAGRGERSRCAAPAAAPLVVPPGRGSRNSERGAEVKRFLAAPQVTVGSTRATVAAKRRMRVVRGRVSRGAERREGRACVRWGEAARLRAGKEGQTGAKLPPAARGRRRAMARDRHWSSHSPPLRFPGARGLNSLATCTLVIQRNPTM